jgi:Putative lumazine-binding
MDKNTKIKHAIADFIKGGDTNDGILLDKILHPNFQNIQDGFFEEKGIFAFSKTDYIKLVDTKRFGGASRKIEFANIDDLGNLAIAKVLLESDFLKFTSYITAVFTGTEWQIVGNIPQIEAKQIPNQ